jgi:hypothetical protein
MSELCRLIFNHQGNLRRDIKSSCDFGLQHGFITTTEKGCPDHDFRWAIPIINVDRDEEKQQELILPKSLYARIVSLLIATKTIDFTKEDVHYLTLVVGGTSQQYIHSDVRKEDYDDDEYAAIMSGPYAPTTIVIKFSDVGTRLAIPKQMFDAER